MAKKRPQGSMGRGVGAANGLLRTTFGRRLLARLAPVHPRGQVVLPESLANCLIFRVAGGSGCSDYTRELVPMKFPCF